VEILVRFFKLYILAKKQRQDEYKIFISSFLFNFILQGWKKHGCQAMQYNFQLLDRKLSSKQKGVHNMDWASHGLATLVPPDLSKLEIRHN